MSQKKKKPYEKPAIIQEKKVETLAGACGTSSDEKASLLAPNPRYGTPCKDIHS